MPSKAKLENVCQILPNFPQNCMELKEFGLEEGVNPKFYYVDSQLTRSQFGQCDCQEVASAQGRGVRPPCPLKSANV